MTRARVGRAMAAGVVIAVVSGPAGGSAREEANEAAQRPAAVEAEIGQKATESLAVEEQLWVERGRGAKGGRADDSRAEALVTACEESLAADPEELGRAWMLQRALWFRAMYGLEDGEARQMVLTRGVEVTRSAIDLLAARAGLPTVRGLEAEALAGVVRADPAAVPVLFWSAVVWGAWGEATGKAAAARQGVGGKIRDYAGAVILLDERYEHAGGHRVVGRLHAEAPRVPFFTWWIDRELAVAELETAVAAAPDFLFNRWYLADALMKHRRRERKRIRELLENLVSRSPSAGTPVEDASILEEARAALRRLPE